MNRRALLAFVLVFVPLLAEAQTLNPVFLNSTVIISYKPDQTHVVSGSGFFVFREVTADKKGHVFLVTNKHVLPAEGSKKSITIRVTVLNGDKPEVTELNIPVVGDNGKYLSAVMSNRDKDVDVAVINITDQVVQNKVQGTWIPYELFVTKEKLKQEKISVGDEIFLLGYPDAIYDPRNVSPILRVGIISTTPAEGFAFNNRLKNTYGLPDKIDGFLIDANVFPGSSGSLVILKSQTASFEGNNITIGGPKSRPYVLGIVSKSIPIDDAALNARQRMGLGVVYSADTIRQTIEQFYPPANNVHP